MSRSLIRPSMLDGEPYAPGMSLEELKERYGLAEMIKLASNENPLGVSPRVIQTLQGQLSEAHRYPRAGSPRLRQALAAHHGIPEDRIVAGNGSDEIIDLLVRVAVEPGREHVLAFRPCFQIYGLQTKLCGAAFRQIPLREDFSFPFEDLLAAVNDATAIVFVTTPDNPSGYAPPVEALRDLLHRLPADCLLVLDEAYMDFAEPQESHSLIALAGHTPNLVVLRTFSKLYGLAGMRLGYGIMPAALADCLLKVKLPFSVNILAEAAGLAAIEDAAFRDETVRTVAEGRAFLARALGTLGFRVYPSQANFLLVKPPMDAPMLFEGLLERGIIVRALTSYGLPDHMRISVGNGVENEALIRAVSAILPR